MARLGVAVFGCYLWTKTRHLKICMVCRMQEKGSTFTGLVLTRLIRLANEEGMFRERDTLVIWSDGAPHFKSYEQVSNYCLHFPQEFNCSVDVRWGCEHHLKGRVDGLFGQWQRRFYAAARIEIVNTVRKLLAAFSAGAKDGERFVEVRPTEGEERKEWVMSHPGVRPDSLPLPIKSTYSYEFKHLDTRRSQARGSLIGVDKQTVTGIRVSRDEKCS